MPRKAGTESAPEARKLGVFATITNLDGPPPRSAWMLFGSEESFVWPAHLRDSLGSGSWTSSKHAKKGDTLFFYFKAPFQAIHCVARASCDAYFHKQYRRWWIDYESMILIKPIHLSKIRELFEEERLLLYVRDGMYIRPDFANRLLAHMREDYCMAREHLKDVRRRVTGKEKLGEPSTITLAGLRELDSAGFCCEAEVEYHILEPLLRVAGVYGQAEVVRKWDLPDNLTADYAVLDSGRKVLCIIEAKLKLEKGSNWQTNTYVEQARKKYAEMCNAPGFVVMDCDRIVCFRTSDELPCLTLDRATLDENGLSALHAHILNQEGGHPSDRQGHHGSVTHRRRQGGDA